MSAKPGSAWTDSMALTKKENRQLLKATHKIERRIYGRTMGEFAADGMRKQPTRRKL